MCKEREWEFFSHGIYNTRYVYGMDEDQERAMIEDSMESIFKHTGQRCCRLPCTRTHPYRANHRSIRRSGRHLYL